MAGFEKYCRQDAIYWEALGYDGTGRMLYAPPIATKVRWEDAMGVVVSRSGGEWRPAVRLITTFLMKEFSKVKLGSLSELASIDVTAQPDVDSIMMVGVAGQTPDSRNRRVLYQAFIGSLA